MKVEIIGVEADAFDAHRDTWTVGDDNGLPLRAAAQTATIRFDGHARYFLGRVLTAGTYQGTHYQVGDIITNIRPEDIGKLRKDQ